MSMTSNVFFCRDAHTVRVRAMTAENICVPWEDLTMEWKTIYTRFTYHQLCILYVFIFIYHNKYRFHFQFRMSFSTKTIITRWCMGQEHSKSARSCHYLFCSELARLQVICLCIRAFRWIPVDSWKLEQNMKFIQNIHKWKKMYHKLQATMPWITTLLIIFFSLPCGWHNFSYLWTSHRQPIIMWYMHSSTVGDNCAL